MSVFARGACLLGCLLLCGPVSAQFALPRTSGTRIQPRTPTTQDRPVGAKTLTQPQPARVGNIAIDTNPQPITLPKTRPATPLLIPQQGTNQPGTARPGTLGVQTQSTQPKTSTNKPASKITPPKVAPPKVTYPQITPPKIAPPKFKTPKLF